MGQLQRRWQRFSLVPKMVLVTILAGCAIFLAVDLIRVRQLRQVFERNLSFRLEEHAHQNRMRLDRYVEGYHNAAKLLAISKYFLDYAAVLPQPLEGASLPITTAVPAWLPELAVLGHLSRIRFALLIDSGGAVREVYASGGKHPPAALLHPSPLLISRSGDQSSTTMIEGVPFVLASATAEGTRGTAAATLLLATPIDDDFLFSSQGMFGGETIVAIKSSGGTLMASSRPDLIPPGGLAGALPARYLSATTPFFDGAGPGLDLQFISFIPRDALADISESVMRGERLERLVLSLVFILTSSLIVLWITTRVDQITSKIVETSGSKLGLPLPRATRGDQIHTLQSQFRLFTDEILANRSRLESQAAAMLQEKTVYLDQILSSSALAIVAVDFRHRIKYCNDAARDLFPAATLNVGAPLEGDGEGAGLPGALFLEAESAGIRDQPYTRTLELDGPRGTRILAASIHRVLDPQQVPIGSLLILQDETQRKEAEARILAALQEKELLLREIHHRVKNNLQIIASLLYLQAEQVAEPRAHKLLQESRDRIKSMAFVHEKLFGSRDLTRVDLAGYLESLAGYLSHVHDAGRRGVRIEVMVRGVTLGIDSAVPCGLIAHELISNALKYAFPDGRLGTIRVAASRIPDGTITLVIEDDGVGLPAGLEIERSPSLGLRLVRQLVRQLRGRMSVSTNGGAHFQMVFPERTQGAKESADGE